MGGALYPSPKALAVLRFLRSGLALSSPGETPVLLSGDEAIDTLGGELEIEGRADLGVP